MKSESIIGAEGINVFEWDLVGETETGDLRPIPSGIYEVLLESGETAVSEELKIND
jgi:hypothetical protein